MKQKNSQLQDIADIRNMMERSSRFLSLSGLAGIFAGIVALAASLTAFFYLDYDERYFNPQIYYSQHLYLRSFSAYIELIILGLLTLFLAIGGSIFFTSLKARSKGLPLWNSAARRMILNLFIPLATGGVFSIAILYHNLVFLVAPATLIFYGLGLINASKYTLSEIRFLGLAEVILGLIASVFIGYGLIFWSVGFGLLHIGYGIWMYIKYER